MTEGKIVETGNIAKTGNVIGQSNADFMSREQDKEYKYNFYIGRYVRVTAFDEKVRII